MNRLARIVLCVALPGLLAAWILWKATASGLVFTPDGVAYLQAARSFATSRGFWLSSDCGQAREWLRDYGALYPALIGLGIKSGWNAMDFARCVNAISAAVGASGVALAVFQFSRSAATSLLAGCLTATLPAYTLSCAAFLSEPPYMALVILGCLGMNWGLARKSRPVVWCGALALGLAATCRFIGLPLALVGAWFAWRRWSKPSVVAGVLACGYIPPAIVAAAGYFFGGAVTRRPIGLHPPEGWALLKVAATVTEWMGGSVLFGLLVLAAVVIGKFICASPQGRPANVAPWLLLSQVLLLLASRTFLDVTIDLSEPRHLIPLFLLGIVAASSLLPNRVMIPVCALLAAMHWTGAPPLPATWNSNHPAWNSSATIAAAADLPKNSCLYSNRPDTLYLHLDRPSEWLPEKTSWFTGEAADWCSVAQHRQARHPSSAYLFFDNSWNPGLTPSPDELSTCLRHTRQTRVADGTVILPLP